MKTTPTGHPEPARFYLFDSITAFLNRASQGRSYMLTVDEEGEQANYEVEFSLAFLGAHRDAVAVKILTMNMHPG